ncbi:DUF4352 domain-containing protein [Tengunoibacter tsumagoiensis]|uniref:DUF4352 domain-containing protein n=1 Tax=Tengunoibacter tsumagoiensis TaxID=2014871 RepID=A0A402A3L0_9CHLR|nr:DUF4352 domain-containing protein [Tengunoibacter tsumagoiensis]GCE13581.1 hypothetical protein KTT_34400 [Tengunoibacter tsumagoiensis]
MVAQTIRRQLLFSSILLLLMVCIAACDAPGNSSTTHTGPVQATATLHQVHPTSVSGSLTQGQGPIQVATPTLVPDGSTTTQQIVLGDRTLIIYSANKQKSSSENATLINLDLAIQNTSEQAIKNQATFFQLLGAEGDTFSYQYNSTDDFYGTIAAHATQRGQIDFQVPTGAVKTISLLYRPEDAKETTIIQLKLS